MSATTTDAETETFEVRVEQTVRLTYEVEAKTWEEARDIVEHRTQPVSTDPKIIDSGLLSEVVSDYQERLPVGYVCRSCGSVAAKVKSLEAEVQRLRNELGVRA